MERLRRMEEETGRLRSEINTLLVKERQQRKAKRGLERGLLLA